jgi:hypothetical protein
MTRPPMARSDSSFLLARAPAEEAGHDYFDLAAEYERMQVRSPGPSCRAAQRGVERASAGQSGASDPPQNPGRCSRPGPRGGRPSSTAPSSSARRTRHCSSCRRPSRTTSSRRSERRPCERVPCARRRRLASRDQPRANVRSNRANRTKRTRSGRWSSFGASSGCRCSHGGTRRPRRRSPAARSRWWGPWATAPFALS